MPCWILQPHRHQKVKCLFVYYCLFWRHAKVIKNKLKKIFLDTNKKVFSLPNSNRVHTVLSYYLYHKSIYQSASQLIKGYKCTTQEIKIYFGNDLSHPPNQYRSDSLWKFPLLHWSASAQAPPLAGCNFIDRKSWPTKLFIVPAFYIASRCAIYSGDFHIKISIRKNFILQKLHIWLTRWKIP